jgi:RNAse (barnase) inhibitor barstar
VSDPRFARRVVDGELVGVWRWPAALDVDVVVVAAAAAEWRVVILDTDDSDSAQGFLESCADAFAFPDWFGMNWDALDESLGDLELGGARGLLVVWSGFEELGEADEAAVATAVDVFRTAVDGWADDGLPATVLLAGPGPDLDLPVPS